MEIQPIEAIVYNQNKVKIDDVIAPPYDVIDEKYQNELYQRSEFNIVKLILTKGENRYEDAKKYFNDWKEKKVLIKIQKGAIFYIIQQYKNEKGKLIERKGFIARNKIEDFSTKKILPHEYTMGGPKQDRLNLVSAAKAFFSQIFMVYQDEKQIIENEVLPKYLNTSAFIDVVDDLGVRNIVYLIDDENDIKTIQKTLSDKTLLIADGHHRYETSMNYSKNHPENEKAKYVMSYFTNGKDENLVIYPTHRVIEKNIETEKILSAVKKYYDVDEYKKDFEISKDEFLDKIEEENKKQITTGLILKDSPFYYILKLKKDKNKEINKAPELQELDLEVLHELILKKELDFKEDELMAQNGIKYEKRESIAFDSVNKGASAVFIMAYPKMDDILKVSSAGLRMPQKSTYFYPKLLSGLVINPLD